MEIAVEGIISLGTAGSGTAFPCLVKPTSTPFHFHRGISYFTACIQDPQSVCTFLRPLPLRALVPHSVLGDLVGGLAAVNRNDYKHFLLFRVRINSSLVFNPPPVA